MSDQFMYCIVYKLVVLAPKDVSCGGHRASSCDYCPKGHGESWCNGDCIWVKQECVPPGKNIQ